MFATAPMMDRPLLDRLGDVYGMSGIAMPDMLRFELLNCADDGAAEKLLEGLIDITSNQDGRRRTPMALQSALRAFEDVLDALQAYRATPFFHLRSPCDLLTALDNARDQDLARVLDRLLGNPDNVSGLLAGLWCGATHAGVVRQRRCEIDLVIDVKIGADWIETGTGDVPWARRLALAPTVFRSIVQAAIESQPVKHIRPNLVRRLRDLAKSSTPRRLHKLIEDAHKHDVNGLDVLGCALSFAGRETGLFPEGLPGDFVQQLRSRPSDIARLARAALTLLKSGLHKQGRLRDAAREHYADQLAMIYEGIAGKPIAYAKGSETARAEVRGRAHGTGLDFMHHGLQVLEGPETKCSSAQRQIDRIRGWDTA
jgi:hypothetical protein